MFLKNRNISSKIKRSKVTDNAALKNGLIVIETKKMPINNIQPLVKKTTSLSKVGQNVPQDKNGNSTVH